MWPQNVTWASVAIEAARRFGRALDIAPARRAGGFGMNVEAIVLLPHQRQFRQKAPLRRAEPAAGPFNRSLRFGIHGLGMGADGVIVVAAHGDCAAIDEIHHGIDRPFGIAAIADIVAEANDPLRAARPRRVEARGERLPVGVDIREDSQQHAFLRIRRTGRSGTDLIDINNRRVAARNDANGGSSIACADARQSGEDGQRLRGASRPLSSSARRASIRAGSAGSLHSSACAG